MGVFNLSQNETILRRFSFGIRWLFGCALSLSSPSVLGQKISNDETLRDSCHVQFESVRKTEADVHKLESHLIPMVRLGSEPDIILYDRLYKVHLTKIANAKSKLRLQESALNGCLANALRERAVNFTSLPGTPASSVSNDNGLRRAPAAASQPAVVEIVPLVPISKGAPIAR
jgi:hypothetical protein